MDNFRRRLQSYFTGPKNALIVKNYFECVNRARQAAKPVSAPALYLENVVLY
jgi:hypothetical protein